MRKRQTEHRTDTKTAELEFAEPMGIVISRGDRAEPMPRFAAYVWGPVPDASEIEELTAVA
ncbi:MAG: hypothetical protein FJ202_06455 [Gemmatimonadetes bacterium]|nr:hypothetical protein [Gemmatimonadota bacterium]